MMKKLPNAVKWLIIVAGLAAQAALCFSRTAPASPGGDAAPPKCKEHRGNQEFSQQAKETL